MFDPLHKWLGIAPHDQPPDHYRLLGLTRFESDPDVIDAAADRQMSFLHGMINGPHGKQAEEISNQVSAARLCLIKDDRRSVYDAQLRDAPRSEPATVDPEDGWLVSHGDGIQHGPFAWSDVQRAAELRKLSNNTFLFHPTETSDGWVKASTRLTIAPATNETRTPTIGDASTSTESLPPPIVDHERAAISVQAHSQKPRKRFPWIAVLIPLVALLGLIWIFFAR